VTQPVHESSLGSTIQDVANWRLASSLATKEPDTKLVASLGCHGRLGAPRDRPAMVHSRPQMSQLSDRPKAYFSIGTCDGEPCNIGHAMQRQEIFRARWDLWRSFLSMSTDRSQKSSEEAILVFRIGSLGDTVVALPAFRKIRRWFPKSRIVLLTNSPVDGGRKAVSSTHVLAGMGLVDHWIEYPHGSFSVRRLLDVIEQIREQKPRICYFLAAKRNRAQWIRDQVFFRLAGIRKIVGLRADAMRHRAPSGASVLWESETERILRAIGAEGCELHADDLSLELTDEEREIARLVLASSSINGRFVAMSLGSKFPAKDWGDVRWKQCLEELGSQVPKYSLVAIGSRVEWDRSSQVLRSWPGTTANLCGELTPRQSAAIIERAQLFIGHDSGPMHLANAVGTPLIAVFSAREMPGIWFPFGQTQNVIYRDVACRGCRLEICVLQKQKCITDIAPAEVVEKAAKLLASTR